MKKMIRDILAALAAGIVLSLLGYFFTWAEFFNKDNYQWLVEPRFSVFQVVLFIMGAIIAFAILRLIRLPERMFEKRKNKFVKNHREFYFEEKRIC